MPHKWRTFSDDRFRVTEFIGQARSTTSSIKGTTRSEARRGETDGRRVVWKSARQEDWSIVSPDRFFQPGIRVAIPTCKSISRRLGHNRDESSVYFDSVRSRRDFHGVSAAPSYVLKIRRDVELFFYHSRTRGHGEDSCRNAVRNKTKKKKWTVNIKMRRKSVSLASMTRGNVTISSNK